MGEAACFQLVADKIFGEYADITRDGFRSRLPGPGGHGIGEDEGRFIYPDGSVGINKKAVYFGSQGYFIKIPSIIGKGL